jgi:hypothetical protein
LGKQGSYCGISSKIYKYDGNMYVWLDSVYNWAEYIM